MQPVYCAHFGLTREPFNATPDPSFLYLSASHQVALAQLIYGIRTRRGFVVLTGEVGTGKTTLLQSLLEELNDGHTRFALLCDLTGGPKEFLRSLCQDFGLTSPLEKENDIQDYLTLLNQFLLESYQKGDNVAVIIDEAQNLSAEVLERVRLLSNFETRQAKLLQILLVGQPELSDRLNEPELRQLKQRVALRYHLTPLSLSECKEYITKRLEISGGTASLFTNGAIRIVHTRSNGIPRLVNILCDNGLLSAYTLRKSSVEPAMIEEIAQNLHLTLAPRSGLVARESLAISPKETSLRCINKWESEVTAACHGQFPIKPLVKPTAHLEFARKSKTAHRILNTPGRPANTSQDKFEVIPGFVSNRFFESMARALVEALGPMASIIIQDQIAAMGESKNAFPTIRLTQLIDEASREIANEEMKIQFHELMSKEIHAINYDPSRSQ